ncbi:RNA-binding protein [Candidatus Woesearchaeota archaeon]|jgi:PUA-domain protein|nr:RNA-binding protein [Candidatus Woesearchaeota archaeon]MBT6519539.1 RNA-binding protein [Candidatus Woesearchaeota archaeon]MBT7367716.1 RNA-binding protein [Candidatus Woesearchaeota archaeon]
MKKQQLSNRDVKNIIKVLKEDFNIEGLISKKDKSELIDDKTIMINDKPYFFYYNKRLIPTLRLLLTNNFLPKVVIDMPAIKFITGGADVMRPGIKEVDEFQKEKIVSIVDENHKKPLAIGIASFSSEEIKFMKSGNVIQNIHQVGDEIWNSI